jgi:hypothetical protein
VRPACISIAAGRLRLSDHQGETGASRSVRKAHADEPSKSRGVVMGKRIAAVAVVVVLAVAALWLVNLVLVQHGSPVGVYPQWTVAP